LASSLLLTRSGSKINWGFTQKKLLFEKYKGGDVMKKLIGVILVMGVILAGSQVFADTISFGDKTIFWSGWSSGDATKDSTDVWGTPDILGGTATITKGYLTNLTFNVISTEGDLWSVLKPVDLFIDTNNDKVWDYVVNLITPNNGTGDQGLYAINQPLYNSATNGNYILSNVPGYGDGSIRNNSPIGFEGGNYKAQTSFNGWPSTLGTGQTASPSFTFGAQDILLGSQFSIGWSVNCANDILYETMNNPVPEPASMLLMGSGFIGLAGLGRKKFFKKGLVVA
jgi:hypothetical protein